MNIIFRAVAALLPLLLAACLNQTSAPSAAPQDLVATAGEGRVTLTWTSEPNLTYWVYYTAGTTVSKDIYTVIIPGITTPAVISGLTNGTEYAFLVTSSNDNSSTGPASSVENAIPRLVGPAATWTPGSPFASGQDMTGIVLGNNLFVAVGKAASIFSATYSYTGAGGVTDVGWGAATTLPAGFSADLSAVIYDGARFAAMGADGSIVTSTDTATWTAGTSVGSTGMNALVYGAGMYIAVGDGGAIYKNTTAGFTGAWTQITSITDITSTPVVVTQNLYGVSYVNGIFVAVGAGGTLLTSTNGDTWTAQTSNTSNSLHQVAFGADAYVAVGDAGTILYSIDAVTWTPHSNPFPTTEDLRTVCFGPDGQFIAAGTAGTVVYSTTGADSTWSAANTGVTGNLNSIVPGDVFIAVGDAGANVSGK